jgi:hypothetical protein
MKLSQSDLDTITNLGSFAVIVAEGLAKTNFIEQDIATLVTTVVVALVAYLANKPVKRDTEF